MKIAIVGSHGVGKTSLLKEFEKDLDFDNYTIYNEAVRQISSIGFPYNEATADCSQLAMLALNLLHLRTKDFITDRYILDILLYSEVLKAKGSNISDLCLDTIRKYWNKYKDSIDLYIFCPPEWETKDDNFRMTDNELRDKISTYMLAKLYLDIPKEKYLIVHGSTKERYQQIKQHLKSLKGA